MTGHYGSNLPRPRKSSIRCCLVFLSNRSFSRKVVELLPTDYSFSRLTRHCLCWSGSNRPPSLESFLRSVSSLSLPQKDHDVCVSSQASIGTCSDRIYTGSSLARRSSSSDTTCDDQRDGPEEAHRGWKARSYHQGCS
jgi:hypothetical protein